MRKHGNLAASDFWASPVADKVGGGLENSLARSGLAREAARNALARSPPYLFCNGPPTPISCPKICFTKDFTKDLLRILLRIH